jgi:nucleoside-diphosphate-sugar epimerase
MQLLWMGDSELADLLAQSGRNAVIAVSDTPALYAALAGGSQDDDACVCLVDFEEVRHDSSVLRTLNQTWPLMPIGLVTRGEDREAAFALLRARAVDRVVPATDLEDHLDTHLAALLSHGQRLHRLHRELSPLQGATLLLTGATGFLGGHFLRYRLRCSGARVVALVRSSSTEPFNQRLAHLERLYPGRIQPVEGDVRLPGLGIAPANREALLTVVDALWHFAADTRFEALLRDELFRTNFDGTRHVIEFARALPGLKHLYHVSTAYVAGDQRRNNRVPEALLTRPASFKNPYEESKYAAECAVAESGLPATIFRPSIILGERVSGLCDGQTVYKVAQLLRLARLSGQRSVPGENQSFRVVVDPDTTKNLVAADDVVFHMLRLAAVGSEPGSYYHLTHPTPTIMADLISVIAGVLNIPEYEAVPTLEGATLSASEAVLQRISGVFRPYMLNSDPEFVRSSPEGWMPPMDQERLQFLLQSFFEQHYGWDFQPGALTV